MLNAGMNMSKRKSKKKLSLGGLLLVVALVLGARLLGIDLGSTHTKTTQTQAKSHADNRTQNAQQQPASAEAASQDELVRSLNANKQSGVEITVSATIIKMLPDDSEGDRHQRFLIRLDNGMTLLVAHNVDIAGHVPAQKGDSVVIHGQYEYNEQGGVLHWTHHDPGGYHEGGWIEHAGIRYE